jgi:hypothetical protein
MELKERIVAAFAAASDVIRGVLADIEVATAAAAVASERARSRALDPSTPDTLAARKLMDDAVFEHVRLAEVAKRLAPRVIAAIAREAAQHRRAELERVLAERNRLAEEMARMRDPIVQIARLLSRIDACNREIKSLGFTQVRHVLAEAPPEITALFGEAFVWDAFHAVARLQRCRQ